MKYYGSEPQGRHSYERVEPAESYFELLSNWRLPKNPTILDVGAGSGMESMVLKNKFNAKVLETDISPYASWAGSEKRNFAIADAMNQPFAGQQFDGIHCKDVLVHIADKDLFMQEIVRLLKFNGSFFTTFYDINPARLTGQMLKDIPYYVTNSMQVENAGKKFGLHLAERKCWKPDEKENNWNEIERKVLIFSKL